MSLNEVPVNALGISPTYGTDTTILVSFKGRGLFRSTDAGANFEAVGQSLLLDNYDLKFIEFSPSYSSDSTIYGASDEALLVSHDSGNSWTVIDRPIRYEDWRGEDRGPITFFGKWFRDAGSEYSASTQTVSEQFGSRASLNFLGNTIEWSGEVGPDCGQARVLIDGALIEIIDLYSRTRITGKSVFRHSGLADGPHTVVIEVHTEKSPDSIGHRVAVDSLDVRRD